MKSPSKQDRPFTSIVEVSLGYRKEVELRTVGSRVRHMRETMAWTQRELSEKSGIATLTILRIENGKTQPRLPTVRKLAEALEISPGWLLFGEEEHNEGKYPTSPR